MVAAIEPTAYLADLNPAQREAVLTTEGPLLVIAGAGSGKTRVLTYRVAHLLAAVGVKPNEILAITFTNKAAQEMKERVERQLGPIARAIWIMTFHSACGRILRREAERLGYRSNFTIYDSADQLRVVKQCLEELERDPKRFVPRGIHSQISNAKNQLIGPDEYASRVASFYDQTVADVYSLYQRKLFASNAVDFDDMLMLTVDVLQRFPEAREKWAKSFRYVMVDEYQDTNHAQYVLLQLLASDHQNLMAVGDPDQCLVAGTNVRMSDGTDKPIEQVRVDDEVLSCYGSAVFRPARVTRVHRSERREGIAITTRSGRRIVSTPEHTHFAGFKPGWTPQLHMTYLMWKSGSGFRSVPRVRTPKVSASRLPGRRSDSTVSMPMPRGWSACTKTRRRHGCPRRSCRCSTACPRCLSSRVPLRMPGAGAPRSLPGAGTRLQRLPGQAPLHRLGPRARDRAPARSLAALRGRPLPPHHRPLHGRARPARPRGRARPPPQPRRGRASPRCRGGRRRGRALARA